MSAQICGNFDRTRHSEQAGTRHNDECHAHARMLGGEADIRSDRSIQDCIQYNGCSILSQMQEVPGILVHML